MKYVVSHREGVATVEAHGIAWFPGESDRKLRETLQSLFDSGVKSVVLDEKTVRSIPTGLHVELEDWARKFSKAGGGLVLTGGGHLPAELRAALAGRSRLAETEEEAASVLKDRAARQTETSRMRVGGLFATMRHRIMGPGTEPPKPEKPEPPESKGPKADKP